MITTLFYKRNIEDQIFEIENEIKILNQSYLKFDLWTLIKKVNELKIILYEQTQSKNEHELRKYEQSKTLRKCDRYNKNDSGIKNIVLRLRQKPDQKSFTDQYQLRYNKQLLHLVLGAGK